MHRVACESRRVWRIHPHCSQCRQSSEGPSESERPTGKRTVAPNRTPGYGFRGCGPVGAGGVSGKPAVRTAGTGRRQADHAAGSRWTEQTRIMQWM